MSADAPILYDWSGAPVASAYAPVTNRMNNALYSPQGGVMQLGSDYGSTAKAQAAKIDALGNQYVVPSNPATGGASQVYTGQAPGALTTQYGTLGMMRQDMPSPAQFVPSMADPQGCLQTHVKSKQTFRGIIQGVSAAQNKYMGVVVNGSSGTTVLRLTVVMIYVTPPGVAGSLLGSNSATYYPLLMALYRVSAANVSGGSTISPTSCDTSDTLSSAVTLLSAPTISSYTSVMYIQDAVAVVTSGESWYQRDDANNKSLVIRPGEGMALICLSSGTIGTASGGTTTASPIMQFVWTQAAA